MTLNGTCSLQHAYKLWLSKQDRATFEESTPYNIIKYYLDGSRLQKDLEPEQKSIIKSTSRN
jgi:hypothetical protein